MEAAGLYRRWTIGRTGSKDCGVHRGSTGGLVKACYPIPAEANGIAERTYGWINRDVEEGGH